jgi:uncharacterized protein (DUF924 family)
MADGVGTQATPAYVTNFWFSLTRADWFTASEGFDAALRHRFAALYERACAGGLDDWAETPHGALALILLLDQVPRNIFRNSARAFLSDEKALAVAKKAISSGFDRGLGKDERLFLYLPFEHAEDLATQDEAVSLIEELNDEEYTSYVRRHRDIIRRFGRFPHRNEPLGRTSTCEELEFLREPGSSF